MQLRHVVTCFLVRPDDGRVLLGQRSGGVSTYPGRWAAVSGSVEEAGPLEQAYREIEGETGLRRSDVELESEGRPVRFTDWDLGTVWVVHPCRFHCRAPDDVRRDWEHVRFQWVEPERIPDMETVPKLAEAWEWANRQDGRPEPEWIFERVREDRDHGADELGVWTLMGLKRAAQSQRESFRETCREALSLRPSMAPVMAAGLDAWTLAWEAGSAEQLVEDLDELISEREQASLRAAEAAASAHSGRPAQRPIPPRGRGRRGTHPRRGADVRNVYFEAIPADLIDEIVTEHGLTRPDALATRARRLRETFEVLR